MLSCYFFYPLHLYVFVLICQYYELLFSYISMLFSMMLTHGVAPQGLLLSTLVPIPKIREAINVTLIIIDKLQ